MGKPELAEAVSNGDLEAIRRLLDGGADARYVRPQGYTVLIDAMHGRPIREDADLLAVLRLLIDRGADPDAVSDYGESALGVASHVGRFDAVGLLLDSGADPAPLGWTALHRAVALGTIADVERRLDAGDDVAARDCWGRTPLLLSVQAGDVGKAELILSAGGSLSDRGRCGKTPLMYAVENDDPATLRWLLERGVDSNATDDFGGTALIAAAGGGVARCVRILLDAGADPNLAGGAETPIRSAANLEIARMLTEAGADFAEVNGDVRDEITGRRRTGSIACSPEDYWAARHRLFGDANPQVMNVPFWRAMVAGGQSAYQARAHFEGGRIDGAPVWCFDRFGMSLTALPDGRVVEIGGEHEDHYDPDFCIYNDVVVHHGGGAFDIYGYPRDAFPPTDFHTATPVGGRIIVIGRLGYRGEREFGTTPVFALDLSTYRIEQLPSRGDLPGWIFGHAAVGLPGGILVKGGEISELADGEERIRRNFVDFLYDPGTGSWKRLADRGWRQITIRDAEGKPFMKGRPIRELLGTRGEPWGASPDIHDFEDPFLYVRPRALLPRRFGFEAIVSQEFSPEDRIVVAGIPISIRVASSGIEVVIEGRMDATMAAALIEDIKEGVEADTGRPCVVASYD